MLAAFRAVLHHRVNSISLRPPCITGFAPSVVPMVGWSCHVASEFRSVSNGFTSGLRQLHGLRSTVSRCQRAPTLCSWNASAIGFRNHFSEVLHISRLSSVFALSRNDTASPKTGMAGSCRRCNDSSRRARRPRGLAVLHFGRPEWNTPSARRDHSRHLRHAKTAVPVHARDQRL